MNELLYAYCYRSGQISFGSSLPEGVLPLGQSRDHEKLRKIVDINASHSKIDNSPFVPRLHADMNEDDALEVWKYFRRVIEMRLNDEKGWPEAPKLKA